MKGGVALGAALVAGTARPVPGDAQSPSAAPPAPDDPSKVLGGPRRPYGERSRFETAIRKAFRGKTDEVGANGIVGEHEVIDARTLPQVKMPNRSGFVPDPRPDVGKPPKTRKR